MAILHLILPNFYIHQRNAIGGEGAMEIGEALKINNTLTTLDLGVRLFYSKQAHS